jgi:hypothetical protein
MMLHNDVNLNWHQFRVNWIYEISGAHGSEYEGAFWDVMPHSLEVDQHFTGAHCLRDWGSTHIWNVCLLKWDYMVLYSRRLSSELDLFYHNTDLTNFMFRWKAPFCLMRYIVHLKHRFFWHHTQFRLVMEITWRLPTIQGSLQMIAYCLRGESC